MFLQTQYAFIHDALSELVVCGATDVAAADIRVLSNEMSEIVERDGITGFQKQFQVQCIGIRGLQSCCVFIYGYVWIALSASGESELSVPGLLPGS